MSMRRVLGAGLAVVALMAFGPISVANAAAGPTITNPATTFLNVNEQFIVRGTATPGAVVAVRYHKAGTPASDYSIVRSVRAAADGAWSRASTLDKDYRVFATVGIGNPHSKTVLFTAATPPGLGAVQDVFANVTGTTLGVQFVAINGSVTSLAGVPAPGNRFVAVKACVRNRGPLYYDLFAPAEFLLGTSTGGSYEPVFAVVTGSPELGFSTPMAINELRCGSVFFDVPTASTVTRLGFRPDFSFGDFSIRWTTA